MCIRDSDFTSAEGTTYALLTELAASPNLAFQHPLSALEKGRYDESVLSIVYIR